jgi:hypothetical protein
MEEDDKMVLDDKEMNLAEQSALKYINIFETLVLHFTFSYSCVS